MKFKQKLQKLMEEMKMERKQFCSITGVPYGSLYDWLTTDKEPSYTRMQQIAEALGIDPNYFFDITPDAPTPVATSSVSITPKEAAELMGVGVEFVHQGLKDGVFPWGYAVKRNGWSYWINRKKFFDVEGLFQSQKFQSPKMGAIPSEPTPSSETAGATG